MSSAVIHLTIPALLIMATGMFPRKDVLKWLPFAVLSDLDFIFNFFGYYVLGSDLLLHRAVGHTAFIGLPTAILWFVLWRRMMKRDPELHWASFRDKWSAFGHVRWGYPAVLMTLYLESHVVLDMFQGGVTLLWPLLNVYVYPRIIVWFNTETGAFLLEPEVQTGSGAPALSPLYPAITPEEVGIVLLSLIAALAALYFEYRAGREPEPLVMRLEDEE
ncbi:MAG: hypothetical protein KY455_05290 [Euryarchaeota archaeon]|nr:hypothetical protein [Euryarchaeota archaeon]